MERKFNKVILALPDPIPDEEKKLSIYFHTFVLRQKVKPFEAPQRSVKIKI